MRIEELITESQVTDEGVLGSIASGIGTGVGAVAKGLGAVSGAFRGAKDQYQKGQALGRAHVGGHMPAQPKDTTVRDQEFARLTGKGGGVPAPTGGAQGGDPKALRAQAADLTKQADEMEKQQQAAQKQAAAAQPAAPLETPPATQPGIGQSSGGNNAVSTNTAPADTSAPAQPAAAPAAGLPASDPVGAAKPGADVAAPMQVQQGGKAAPNPALDARRAALAQSKADTAAGKGVTGAIKTGTMGEGLEEGYYSNFLGQML